MPSGMDASLEEAGIIIAWTSPASNDMSSYRSDLTWEGTWQTSARVYNRLGKAKAELAIAIHRTAGMPMRKHLSTAAHP